MPLRKRTNYLREARVRKGLSGYDLQILSNIPAQEIYRIERGLKRPKAYERALLSKALGAEEDRVFPKGLESNGEIEQFSETLLQAGRLDD